MKTVEEQTRVFYRLVDTVSREILISDYYARQNRTLYDLDVELGLFSGDGPLEAHKEVLISGEQRNLFFDEFDIHEQPGKWLPHFQALNLLLESESIAKHVKQRIPQLVKTDPAAALALLHQTFRYSRLSGVARIIATEITGAINDLPEDMRPYDEETILLWRLRRNMTVGRISGQ